MLPLDIKMTRAMIIMRTMIHVSICLEGTSLREDELDVVGLREEGCADRLPTAG